MNEKTAITDVSDTALWVAALRGKEGARADAAFRDPLASILAGERGRRIARSIPHSAQVAWAMAVRTSAIDRLITEALGKGVDTILNLGAGLDTRPYRMCLPAQLRWIEIDFPNIIELKNSALLGHAPACKVERVAANLLDRPARSALFTRYGSQSENALLIAEGVIPYFSNDDVGTLAEDLFSIPSFRHWIMDFDNAGKRAMPRSWAKQLQAAPFLFQVDDWFEFLERFSWRPLHVITSLEQSELISRPYPFDFPLGLIMHALPRSVSRKILSLSGAVLMQKQHLQVNSDDA